LGIGLNIILNRKILVISSFISLIILIVIFSLPNLLAASLEPKQAEDWIRIYLKKKVSAEYVEQVKNSGLNLPSTELAERWQNDIKNIEDMDFESLEIRHFLIAPPTSSTRIYVVKAIIMGLNDKKHTRYFSLTARNRYFDFFWVSEHSKWMWLFSI
jgi:hypothetical protein